MSKKFYCPNCLEEVTEEDMPIFQPSVITLIEWVLNSLLLYLPGTLKLSGDMFATSVQQHLSWRND